MENRPGTLRLSGRLLALGLGCALLGGLAGAGVVGLRSDQWVHGYIVAHPEVLPEAMEVLRHREDEKALADVRQEVEAPFPGAVLGNPRGARTLVEFTDYACGFCRRSVADVEHLIAADPQLRVVVRQLPIIAPESVGAARMALAAARQGKFAAFHHAMFAAGRPDAQGVAEAARQAGMDMAAAHTALSDPKIDAELSRNVEMARKLGFSGTPAWIAGGRLLSGAIGAEALARALDGNAS